jgi:integrase
MIAHVYRPRRRGLDGKSEAHRLYRGRFRLAGEVKITEVALNTTDRQVAEKKLAEIISERERERAGLIAPRLERQSAQRTLAEHQRDFAADLVALGRTPKYAKDVTQRVERLVKECSWRFPSDVTANSFVAWRARQQKSSPKTLNEYLNSVCALLNWMTKQGRISENPLKAVTHADVRGKQKKRRAFTDEELNKLLAVAPANVRLLYLAAAFTGLRAGELKQVVWSDLRLDDARPHIIVRASTTKNRKEAMLPLHPQLLAELKAIHSAEHKAEDLVFLQYAHIDERIQIDLRNAGIARIDAMGRKLDFHALRYTFATKLASSGVSQRLAQELMRHSDPRLTANIYTDATQLPTFAAVNALKWQSGGVQPASPERKTEKPTPTNDTVVDPQSLDFACQNSAQPVALSNQLKPAHPSSHQGFGHVLANFATGRQSGKKRKLGAGVGFEPTTFRL